MEFIDMEKIRANVKARREATDACPGHHFPNPSEKALLRGWRCANCDQLFDAHEIAMYQQGLRHAEKGHRADAVLPAKWPAPAGSTNG